MAPSQQAQQRQTFNCFVPGTASSTTRGIWSDRTLRSSQDKVEARQAARAGLLGSETFNLFCAVASEGAYARSQKECMGRSVHHQPDGNISCPRRVMRFAPRRSRVDARGLWRRAPEGGAQASVLGTKTAAALQRTLAGCAYVVADMKASL